MTGVAGAPSVPLPLPLSGDTEGSEGDSGENDDDENSNDDDDDENSNDDDDDENSNDDDDDDKIIVMMRKMATEKEITSLEMTHFLINKLIRMSSYFCKSGCLQSMNLVI